MVDEADITVERMEREEALRRQQQFVLVPGKPGECDLCGEWSGRLVNGVCAPCRDKYRLT